jgi:hypothetical protein
VYLPTMPVSASPLNAARPAASVVAVAFCSDPVGPEEIVAVTATPACGVGLPS